MLSYEKSGGVTAGGMLDKQHMTNAAVAIGAGFVSVAAVSERAAIRSIATHARNKSQKQTSSAHNLRSKLRMENLSYRIVK